MSASVGGEGVNLGIIITPMLDMAFQLLAFFVMTYHPHAAEGHIDGKLLPPKAAVKGPENSKPKDDTAPSTEPDPEGDALVVVVKAMPRGQVEGKLQEGDPTRIQLKRPEGGGTAETIADVDADAVTEPTQGERVLRGFEAGLDKLKLELEKAQKAPGGAQSTVSIEADPGLHHGWFVRVYDVCKAAGFKGVGFVPPALSAQGR